jgi:periplasmic divalent cation tolerance protein
VKSVILISTYPNKKAASKIARDVIKNKLAACVNISQVSSVYSWKGNIENTREYLALFKTTQNHKNTLKEMISKTHPYDVPEIAEIDFKILNKLYLDWFRESTI